MPEFGEIYVCRFPFTSGAFSKPRPVLVLFDLGVAVLICRITSVFYSGHLDVELRDWSLAGLEKPSVA
jgi:mRNA interferase MazF